jgi:hypothetical protein
MPDKIGQTMSEQGTYAQLSEPVAAYIFWTWSDPRFTPWLIAPQSGIPSDRSTIKDENDFNLCGLEYLLC